MINFPSDKLSEIFCWWFLCSIVSCSALNLTNGMVSYNTNQKPDGQYVVETIATFTCDPGYSVDGLFSTICNVSGNWGQPTPICTGTIIKQLRNLSK